jgi:hypothetical protein
MSILMVGGRSATARRFSQAAIIASNCQLQWPSAETMRHESQSMGRRRALDIYGTKDILFSHEQMKKAAKRSLGSVGGITSR